MPEPTARLAPDDLKWLHDKFERLSAEEAQLASARTTYYAAIGTVLITGLVVALADLINEPHVLIVVVTFLAALGILISFVWAVLLHRTNDAQNLWREAASQLELDKPPLEGDWIVPITLRSGDTLKLNMLHPYLAHRERFSTRNPISWMDGVNPDTLTEVLPLTFLSIWVGVLIVGWTWFLVVVL
jgi:hypothetical protein